MSIIKQAFLSLRTG